MHTTTIDIRVDIVDSAGTPVSAPLLYGVIRNIRGEIVRVLTLDDLVETSVGVYELIGFDVSDSNLFPGTEFSIFWCTKSDTVTPKVGLRVYEIYGDHPSGFVNRLITWCPSYKKEHLYGYEISRRLVSEDEPTVIGRSVFPYFFDTTVYTNIAEFHRAEFIVTELIWRESTPNEPGLGVVLKNVVRTETRHNYTKVFGSVADVIGGHSADMLSFFVHESDAPQISGSSFLMRRNEVSVPINERGEFSVPLIQGALVTVELADIGLHAKFTVPCVSTVNLKDIKLYPVDTHRAQ